MNQRKGKAGMERVMQRVRKNKDRATLFDALEYEFWRQVHQNEKKKSKPKWKKK